MFPDKTPYRRLSPTMFETGNSICRLIDDLLAEVYGVKLGDKQVKIRVEEEKK